MKVHMLDKRAATTRVLSDLKSEPKKQDGNDDTNVHNEKLQEIAD